MADTEAIYQSYVTYEEGKKSKFIELRDEQKAAVKAAKDYFEKSADNQRFLWNAKMRFGKTFCAMELAIEMGESEVDPKGKKDSKPISRVLIITHKPVVQDGFATDLKKLQESLIAKGHRKREWGFGTRSEKDDFGNFFNGFNHSVIKPEFENRKNCAHIVMHGVFACGILCDNGEIVVHSFAQK